MNETSSVLWPDWETVELIGRGSFGTVYEIQRDHFGHIDKAALKVISIPQNAGDIEEMRSDGYDDESIISAFKSHLKSIVAEYFLMRKMTGCSNIVNCDDIRYIQHDDGIGWDIFIKMELLTPLTKALPERIDDNTVIKIAKDMCGALELCKKHGIVHRDIKPQNIFVSEHGDYKLGDFGIAKTVEKTMGGTKIGTTRYMAPEVYHYQPYGHTSDIYSLGLVLYWLLNERRMPFMPLPPEKIKAGADKETTDRRLSGETLPAPVRGSEKLKRIVLKACAYNPKDRYQTAEDMLDDIKMLFINSTAQKRCSDEISDVDISDTIAKLNTSKHDDAGNAKDNLSNFSDATQHEEKLDGTDRGIRKTATGWYCVCGRENPLYVSTCFCGINKYDMSSSQFHTQRMQQKETEREYVNGRIYYSGDEVIFEGVKYACIAPGNAQCVWDPKRQPEHWKLVSKEFTQQEMSEEDRLRLAHQYWSKSRLENKNEKEQHEQKNDDWRRSEAAYRAWQKSLEKNSD